MDYLFNSDILRAYDIRGTIGKTLSALDAYYLGRRFAYQVRHLQGAHSLHSHEAPLKICVGRDGRLSSPELSKALIQGLIEEGVHVVDMGLGPTPMLYYMIQYHRAHGGIMVTGSHNPPQDNGFKLSLYDRPFFGQDIQTLNNITVREGTHKERGNRLLDAEYEQDHHLVSSTHPKLYLDRILINYKENTKPARTLKVVWDCSNGAAGAVIHEMLSHLRGEHIVLNDNIDGTFPAHAPDPSVKENLSELIDTVVENKADLGIAFDGDGDRIAVVDSKGRFFMGDQLLLLYAQDLLARHPGAKIIADVKSSRVFVEEVTKAGGIPIIWKTGHSYIKEKIKESGALLAGEVSGHMFFSEDYYGYDDALYGAIILLKILENGLNLDEWYDNQPKYYTTTELKYPCPDDKKFHVIQDLKKDLESKGFAYNDIDGVRVETTEGWWLIRASNTQACLVVRCEAKTQADLNRLLKQAESFIEYYKNCEGIAVELDSRKVS